MRAAVLAIVVTLSASAACGKSESDASEGEPKGGAGAGGLVLDVAPAPHPTTEEGLVELVAAAIEARDLERLRSTAAPELAADLARMHDRNPGEFWRKGQRWVANVQSGLSIAQRTDDPDGKRWKALLKFGNGKSETVVFTRVEGKLLFEQL